MKSMDRAINIILYFKYYGIQLYTCSIFLKPLFRIEAGNIWIVKYAIPALNYNLATLKNL